MLSRIFIVVILVFSVLSAPVFANKSTLKEKIKKIFYPNTVKTKPMQVKTIPAGAACTPDIPKNCDVKN